MQTINLGAEEYNDFLRCLTNLKEICNDVDIREGKIRQRSNDLTSIFEMDLTSLIQDVQLPITNVKKKLDILKSFSGQAVTIEVVNDEESGNYYTISDEQTSIKFSFPSIEFMDNKIMTEEELNTIFDLDDENLIISHDLSSVITDRIRVITYNFNTQAIQVKFHNDLADIVAITQAKDQFAKFKTDISLNMGFDGNFSSNLSTIPFGIEHDTDLDFKMYKVPEKNICLNKISTELGSISINIYSRSAIIQDE